MSLLGQAEPALGVRGQGEHPNYAANPVIHSLNDGERMIRGHNRAGS